MTTKTVSNPCIRCGKERIVFKEWTEKTAVGYGKIITYTETTCPDTECQTVVYQQIAAARLKKEMLHASKKI